MQQKLFDDTQQLTLPQELMEYTPGFLSKTEGDELLQFLLEIAPWQQHTITMYDKEVLQPRMNAWYGDRRAQDEGKREANPWTPELLRLKEKIETFTGIAFNGVLLNLYRNGNDSVAWHSDKNTLPGLKTEIASISIGEERNFDFRSKANHRLHYSIRLQHGSLLLMKGDLQRFWEHRIAKTKASVQERINLTFRKVLSTY